MQFSSAIIWHRVFFRAAFWVVGVVFFVMQLSAKFYQRANLPVHHRYVREHRLVQGRLRRSFSIPDEGKESRLTLDKRYDLTATFDMPAPVIAFVHYPTSSYEVIPLYSANLRGGIPVITCLRGPPSTI